MILLIKSRANSAKNLVLLHLWPLEHVNMTRNWMVFNAPNPPLQTSVFYNVPHYTSHNSLTFTEDGSKNFQECTSTKWFNVIIELERWNVGEDEQNKMIQTV